MPDDAELLRRYARDRAEDAFAEFVRRHLDAVYSAALRRVGGDTHLAEDVAQHVFTATACEAERLVRHPHLGAWLYATTRNVAANVVRGERRRKAREQEAQVMHTLLSEGTSGATAPGSSADWNGVAPVLDAAIDQLSASDRAVVLLRFVERRAFGEIGATLRLTEDAARMRVDRALDKLRVMLARRGVTSTSTALGVAMANHAVGAAPAGLAAAVSGVAVAATVVSATTVSASVGAMNFLGAMSTTKFAGVITGLAVAIMVGVFIHGIRVSRAAEGTRTVAMHEADILAARLRDVQQSAEETERAATALQMSFAEAARGQGRLRRLPSNRLRPFAIPPRPEKNSSRPILKRSSWSLTTPALM